ncbi:MAG: hypothetical protein FWD66_01105 [Paludibacter sp.]|nr:hypothetical protein [Paludibacter sp.]
MKCSELNAGLVTAICGKKESKGAEGDVILINYDDIDREHCMVTDNIISELELKTGKTGFAFTTFGRSLNESGATFARGTYTNSWTHTVPLKIFVKTEEAKTFVNKLSSGARIVAILKNRAIGTAGEVKYEVYGWDNGLELSESANTIAMADDVVYTATVASTDTAQEGSLPKSIFKTDSATTELLLQNLLVPAE